MPKKPKDITLKSVYDHEFIYSGIRISPGQVFKVQVTPTMKERKQDAEFMANHLVSERGWCERITKEE